MKTSKNQTDADSFQVPALDRALSILELLATRPEGLRMREIAEKLELPANSVFRITGLLEERDAGLLALGAVEDGVDPGVR